MAAKGWNGLLEMLVFGLAKGPVIVYTWPFSVTVTDAARHIATVTDAARHTATVSDAARHTATVSDS